MARLRIGGIVSVANQLRQSLSAPITPEHRSAIAVRAARTVAQVDSILRANRASAEQLPAPSRRAYEFLKELSHQNSDATRPSALPAGTPGSSALPAGRAESIRFPGLRTFLTRVLDDIALTLAQGRFRPEASLQVIRTTAERLDHLVTRERIEPAHLKPEARQLFGWFRIFSTEPMFHRYVEAVRRAQRVLLSPLSAQPRWKLPFLIHYRPSAMLYRLQVTREGTRMIFDAPMITFDEAALRLLAQRILGRSRGRREMMALMTGPAYRQMLTELEAAGGTAEQTRGQAHDLAESFDRVNREYFAGQMPRPVLYWSRTLTGRKFGHYDFIHDRVCISRTLDHHEVPAYVVDHVMHHELLHKKHGFRFHGNRQHAHTPEFRREERTFRHYQEADIFLKRISAQ